MSEFRGMMKSSAELIHRTGALCGLEVAARVRSRGGVEVVEEVVGVGVGDDGIDDAVDVVFGLLSRREVLLHLLRRGAA